MELIPSSNSVFPRIPDASELKLGTLAQNEIGANLDDNGIITLSNAVRQVAPAADGWYCFVSLVHGWIRMRVIFHAEAGLPGS
jgi:hypothetical protein